MNPRKSSGLLLIISLLVISQFSSSCSTSQAFRFAKGTGAFKDPYKTNSPKNKELTQVANLNDPANELNTVLQSQVTGATEKNTQDPLTEKLIIQKPSRKQLKQLKNRLEAILDTTKKRDRVTIKTNEKKVDELRNEVQGLKNSVKAEKEGDKVVVSFDKPQTSLSKEAKILIIVGAALLLVALLSLPVIGPVLGVILGIAVVAAALALVLGVIEIS
ncbi:hypothetical protein AHMF7605_18260 [Adhaeribacter arboris]|uniref:DUF4349 domain-containing protein n=1 Tax=Adhaeribacter arboris TaxID=2072846 RepID=A0A2T2YII6_9BACT|nr:hypothetical protein [Adhaeribacter arboris]PSR55310.1 hypothetical protein AHMF7605_18260 [Adhaeribacter arboris]